MVFTILLFILLGRYLDSLFHVNPPWFTILFALLASVGSIIMLIKKVK
jgi:F0F1-type ATP synthase assembly protein I